jgi:hypothetical protein
MTVITTSLVVAADGSVSTATPLPAGEHLATIALATRADKGGGKPFELVDFPTHDSAWDDRISLRREDLYDDDGRLRG